jgi:hypothetical protein
MGYRNKKIDNWEGNSNIINDCFGVNRKKVNWFSGYLIIPQGVMIGYFVYEYYLIIEIENGNIINEFTLDFNVYEEFFNENIRERNKKIWETWNNINFPRN